MFISEAYAQTAGGGDGGLMGLLLFVLIFVVFYFLLIRPQQKRAKEHQAMVGALKRGDKVVTSGGIVGKVSKVVDDNHVEVEIATDVKVKIVRSTIGQVIDKTQPANDDKK
ncbi:preprotein translocase subunit YajC [Pseudemcibacter aquimaris]|uniref:preprotein translocase subunit YajC n=1 Tax=Pseudemcibacter aquimaris TaxID=2857064 RepID=UPI002013358E|nr:preprotein translocase subunit YajC [Pseudemcibacter aquimaris]MCC3860131.1 preprotein translocase subunit YajC [Pseudemcibacter aquimaris]WDU57458.1 preprotein translocase subunit YajC [Pseudemcibacter aquimaris]